MRDVLIQSWPSLARSLILVAGSYAALLVFLRLSGKRTLSKMNAFDLVVTVSLGSTLATIGLSKDVALAQGALVLLSLISLQFIVAWLSVRSNVFQSLVKAQPAILFRDGHFFEQTLRRERVTREEVLAAMRSQGVGGANGVAAVVLETDGSFSIIKSSDQFDGSTLKELASSRGA